MKMLATALVQCHFAYMFFSIPAHAQASPSHAHKGDFHEHSSRAHSSYKKVESNKQPICY